MLDAKQIVEYIQTSSEVITELQEKIASLEDENKRLEDEGAELKEAAQSSEVKPVFTEEAIRPVMDKLAQAKLLKNATKATRKALEDPASLLLALDKLAQEKIDSLSSVRQLGAGIDKAASHRTNNERASDRAFEETFTNLSQRL